MEIRPSIRRAITLLRTGAALAILVISAAASGSPQEPADTTPARLVFSCPIPASSESALVITSLYQAVFDKLHIEFKLLPVPTLRESVELEKGTYDGSCGRTESFLLNNNPHYVRLAHPITYFSLTFFSTRPISSFHRISDLPPGSRVLYTTGSLAIENQLRAMEQVELIPAKSTESAFRMLAADRADFFITGHRRPRSHQDEELARYRHPGIHRDFYSLFKWNYQGLYPYLHKRHLHLKPALEAELERQLQHYPDGQLGLPEHD
ncbi:hypothetical protein [Pseudomaricurvus sp. HS19]|uniref:hypothetical protein n=1 Tax=Pseudomaricurvus sp. HS19 TaxID=2692626 RepID=UPI0013692421|nr:hypothetical protein [Pseudomaricurvus sp. HS19]MYM62534.1 hypothetical protein [Pseudomaricurvus sp. HS19]